MVKRLVDDSIVTADTGTDRMYLELTPTLRLRSDNPYQVALERFRKSEPTRKSDTVYDGWFFEGYYPNEHFFDGSRISHTKVFKANLRKSNKPLVAQNMIQLYLDVWQHINSCDIKLEDIAEFIRKAKAHELQKQETRKGNTKALEAWHERRKADQAINE
jgi:hypothetical protein